MSIEVPHWLDEFGRSERPLSEMGAKFDGT